MRTKMIYVALALFASATFFTACNSKPKSTTNAEEPSAVVEDRTHNSRNSLDYEGTYTGTLPCADCSGIYMEITLSGDQFQRKMVYQGKDEAANTFEDSGVYTWNDEGSIITLGGDPMQQYQVGENQLFALDAEGKRITGDLAEQYILKK